MSGNGNGGGKGNGIAGKFGLAALAAPPANEVATYQSKLRAAMFDGIAEGDIREIVTGIVKRAKKGDDKAIKLVFDYLLGGVDGGRPNSATQVNVYNESAVDHPSAKKPDRPTLAGRGTRAKVEAMAERAERGEELHHEEDHDPE